MELLNRIFFWAGVLMVADGLIALIFRRKLGKMIPQLDIPIFALVEIILGLGILLLAID